MLFFHFHKVCGPQTVGWSLRMKGLHLQSHVKHQSRGHVSSQNVLFPHSQGPLPQKLVGCWIRMKGPHPKRHKKIKKPSYFLNHRAIDARRNHQVSNKKGVFKNFSKLTGNHLWRSLFLNIVFSVFFNNVFFKNSDTGFFLSIFWNFWEHLFLRILQGDCFLIDLMVKKFNVSLIFLNLQRYHAPPEWSLLFWCNEEHLLMKKMSGVNSGIPIICEWNKHEHVLTFFKT